MMSPPIVKRIALALIFIVAAAVGGLDVVSGGLNYRPNQIRAIIYLTHHAFL
jgi:hypothetical protein